MLRTLLAERFGSGEFASRLVLPPTATAATTDRVSGFRYATDYQRYAQNEEKPATYFDVLIAALAVFALIRFGILALMSGIVVLLTLGAFLFAADFSAWYAHSSLFAIGSVLALTAYAMYTALAGRPLFKAGFLEND